MNSAVCTVFEGHYHYGVAALANSLYINGFRGDMYVGYRGSMPPWAAKANYNAALGWENAKTFQAAEGMQLHFLPLVTDYHLTNYKPDFMLQLWEGPAKEAEAMFYFDPDIVVVAPWNFFEEWCCCGVAVCEDINSPLYEFHPRRVYWRNYFKTYKKELNFSSSIYVNGGFVGVHFENICFIDNWRQLQELMAKEIGGLNKSIFNQSKGLEKRNNPYYSDAKMNNPFYAFGTTDQDALNAAIEAYEGKISSLTKSAMAIESGTHVMPHALGSIKPWKKKFFLNFFKGNPPTLVDKYYWANTLYPIKLYPSLFIKMKFLAIKTFSFLSRFYKK